METTAPGSRARRCETTAFLCEISTCSSFSLSTSWSTTVLDVPVTGFVPVLPVMPTTEKQP